MSGCRAGALYKGEGRLGGGALLVGTTAEKKVHNVCLFVTNMSGPLLLFLSVFSFGRSERQRLTEDTIQLNLPQPPCSPNVDQKLCREPM